MADETPQLPTDTAPKPAVGATLKTRGGWTFYADLHGCVWGHGGDADGATRIELRASELSVLAAMAGLTARGGI